MMNSNSDSIFPNRSVRNLLSELIDYAGLFPPAMLSMKEAVANFAHYRNSKYAWMLGRFIVPAARLDEFAECAGPYFKSGEEPWRLSVLAGEDVNDTVRRFRAFNEEHASLAVCDSLEVKASTESKIENTVALLPEGVTTFFEIAMGERFVDLVSCLAMNGQRAKIRTGGVERDAFPTSQEVVRFVRTCMAANVPFKATAGLHHPLRCFRPLTYAEDAPSGTMHGFLNLMLMTAFVREGYRPSLLEDVMEEEFREVFQFTENGVRWRDEHFLHTSLLERVRQNGMISFGSCSFTEPVEDLLGLGLL